MNKVYLITDYRTFLIGFKNSSRKIIFQDYEAFRKSLETGELEGLQVDINSIKELNSFGRFVRLKDIPNWLIIEMGKAVEKIKTERVMVINEMK